MQTPHSDFPPALWRPSPSFKANARLTAYIHWLEKRRDLRFPGYEELWNWSVSHPADFWHTVSDFFGVIHHQPFREVLSDDPMPDARWFAGSTLNYAEHLFRHRTDDHPAIMFQSERHPLTAISWGELEERVASLQHYLRQCGIGPGDRVVAYLPNIPEATIAFLAACSLGAVWSSCSPDFGASSVIDRFQQVEPKVLIAVDGYQYNGKAFSKRKVVKELIEALPTLERVIWVPYLEPERQPSTQPKTVSWAEATAATGQPLNFTAVPFEHPIWVLYSSGTTGAPKAITHSHGGVLLEHLKYLAFHNDVHPGERFFWYTTTGWMMWNFVQAAFLAGATIVLYDGSPAYPDLDVLWRFADEAGIHHFGTSAPFLVACMKEELKPGRQHNLQGLRSIGSTGAPLPPEAFDWVYQAVKEDLWLCSMSGGTDVCTAFVGGCPLEPVYYGEIQCRALGCALYAFDEEGQSVVGEVGEMVITKPMPSMPIFFWNDPGKKRYLSSYFEMYPGIWRHGDWVEITPRHTLIIYGRSDATLNRQGIRIGTSEIYRAVNKLKAVKDSLIVNLELSGGRHYMPLFVLLNEGESLDEDLRQLIKKTLKEEYSPRHVPDEIIEVPDIPYTISGKKLEAPVKKILLGRPAEQAAKRDALRNPEAIDFFVAFAKKIK